MDFFERVEAVRDRRKILDHPFYERWSRGDLTREELACYAAEYHHATVALAETAAAVAQRADGELRAQLELHAREEAEHVGLWDEFAAAVGAATDREPEPETADCVAAWTSARDLTEGLVILYAIESGQPAVSEAKLAGLVAHYGFREDSPATMYFSLHAELDRQHAAEAKTLIEPRLNGDDKRLLRRVEQALDGNWRLLDGVERRFEARARRGVGSRLPLTEA